MAPFHGKFNISHNLFTNFNVVANCEFSFKLHSDINKFKYLHIIRKLYKNSLSLPLFLYTEYHLARRRGEISYKEGIKADNFRINSGISKHCIITYHQWIDRCSANMNIIKWCAYNSRPLSVIFLPYNTE